MNRGVRTARRAPQRRSPKPTGGRVWAAEKPERHARSGKSRESPHFRSGRARSRDVGCQWDGSRPACASPPRKRASGFACTPLRRRSAFAGAWLRGRNDSRLATEISYIPSGQAESCPGGSTSQPRGRRLLELLLQLLSAAETRIDGRTIQVSGMGGVHSRGGWGTGGPQAPSAGTGTGGKRVPSGHNAVGVSDPQVGSETSRGHGSAAGDD